MCRVVNVQFIICWVFSIQHKASVNTETCFCSFLLSLNSLLFLIICFYALNQNYFYCCNEVFCLSNRSILENLVFDSFWDKWNAKKKIFNDCKRGDFDDEHFKKREIHSTSSHYKTHQILTTLKLSWRKKHLSIICPSKSFLLANWSFASQ